MWRLCYEGDWSHKPRQKVRAAKIFSKCRDIWDKNSFEPFTLPVTMYAKGIPEPDFENYVGVCWYSASMDEFSIGLAGYIYGAGCMDTLDETLLHELGHYYWYKYPSAEQKRDWTKWFNDNRSPMPLATFQRVAKRIGAQTLKDLDKHLYKWHTNFYGRFDYICAIFGCGWSKRPIEDLKQFLPQGETPLPGLFRHAFNHQSCAQAKELFAEAFAYYLLGKPLPGIVRDHLVLLLPKKVHT